MFDSLFASPWLWWIVGAILIGFEIVAPGVLLLWIGLGAMLVGLSVWLAPNLPLAWQLLVFAVAMLGSIAVGFMVQRRGRADIASSTLNREVAALVGRQVEAVDAFQNGRGRVRVGDSSYAAICAKPVAAGQSVLITGLDGDGRLVVSPQTGV